MEFLSLLAPADQYQVDILLQKCDGLNQLWEPFDRVKSADVADDFGAGRPGDRGDGNGVMETVDIDAVMDHCRIGNRTVEEKFVDDGLGGARTRNQRGY